MGTPLGKGRNNFVICGVGIGILYCRTTVKRRGGGREWDDKCKEGRERVPCVLCTTTSLFGAYDMISWA